MHYSAPPPNNNALALILVAGTGPSGYSLEEAARLAGVQPARLRLYCQLGLFGTALNNPDEVMRFDDGFLYELRRLERFRKEHGARRRTLRLICGLWQEIERLEAEVRFLRRP